MFNKIDYFAPYFNDTTALRKAYQELYPTADFDNISSMMVGALSVFVPTEKFNELIATTLAEAEEKRKAN
jgi:hypothetical protein